MKKNIVNFVSGYCIICLHFKWFSKQLCDW